MENRCLIGGLTPTNLLAINKLHLFSHIMEITMTLFSHKTFQSQKVVLNPIGSRNAVPAACVPAVGTLRLQNREAVLLTAPVFSAHDTATKMGFLLHFLLSRRSISFPFFLKGQ